MTPNNIFCPHFSITANIAQCLKEIDASKTNIENISFSPALLTSLREASKLLTVHYSTQIEGNILSGQQVKQVIVNNSRFVGRERDELEVRNYYRALGYVEQLASSRVPISENAIKTIAMLVNDGRARRKPYRKEQNVIRNSVTDAIIYMPPRANDVQQLMTNLVIWVNENIDKNLLPIPLIAGLAQYQFATIHPYFDGNGRTARLLASWILQKTDYGMNGIYSLDEYYAKDLPRYYGAFDVCQNHNYYDGRVEADVTPFLEYFCCGMAVAFRKVETQAKKQCNANTTDDGTNLKILLPEQRQALSILGNLEIVTAADIGRALHVSDRQAKAYCQRWVKSGFLIIADQSQRLRRSVFNKTFR
jgi:Fic family protein